MWLLLILMDFSLVKPIKENLLNNSNFKTCSTRDYRRGVAVVVRSIHFWTSLYLLADSDLSASSRPIVLVYY